MFNTGRLLDVFLLGPIQIMVGLNVKKNVYLRAFMIITGIMNILYNGHNYLYFEGVIDVADIFDKVVDRIHGKIQIHRLYNILIMYPLFIYTYRTIKLPIWLKTLFFWDIVIGYILNSVYFIKLL